VYYVAVVEAKKEIPDYKLVTKVRYEQRFTALAKMQPTNRNASASPCHN
jgi:hypothetical protein